MALNDSAVIEFLAKFYPGPVASRALWLWAGGKEDEIEYKPQPLEQWHHLWNKARQSAGVTPATILRETLFDRPGHPELLGFLDTLTSETFPEGQSAAVVLVKQLEMLDPDFDPVLFYANLVSNPRI